MFKHNANQIASTTGSDAGNNGVNKTPARRANSTFVPTRTTRQRNVTEINLQVKIIYRFLKPSNVFTYGTNLKINKVFKGRRLMERI